MTNNTADVNAAFDAEKFEQMNAPADRLAKLRENVAAGKFSETDNGNGTLIFRVIQGWDAGETFRFNTADLTVTANHGLDLKANGDVAFYGTDPAWWSLGRPVSKKATTTTEVLSEAGLLWTVEQMPNTYTNPVTGEIETVPGEFLNYRSDTGKPLGTVGKIYHPFQNITAFSIIDELIGFDGVEIKTAGSFRDGKKIFVTAEVPTRMIKGANGVEDTVRMFINIINTHDGNGSLVAAYSPWFIRCQNTARLAVDKAAATYKIRHTVNGLNKIVEAQETFRNAGLYFDTFVQEETELINAPATAADVDWLIAEVYGAVEDSKRGATLAAKRREQMHEIWAIEVERLGANMFALENVLTGQEDHNGEVRPRGELKGNRLAAIGQNLLEDTTAKRKSAGHKLLMNRVRGS